MGRPRPDFFFATRGAIAPGAGDRRCPRRAHAAICRTNLWYAPAHIEPRGPAARLPLPASRRKASVAASISPPSARFLISKPGVPSGMLSDEDHPHQQDLRRHEERVLDLCARAIRSANVPRRSWSFRTAAATSIATEQSRQLNVIDNLIAQKENPGDDLRLHQSRRHYRLARHANLQFRESLSATNGTAR